MQEQKKKRIAYILGVFPATSMTFIINQVADLMDRGYEIDVFTFNEGDIATISERYTQYDMASRTTYIGMPENRFVRVLKAIPKMLRLLVLSPRLLMRTLNVGKYGRNATSLKYLFWSEPFVGKKYDLIHCHEGHVANRFMQVKDIVKPKAKILTSLLGQDISRKVKQNPGVDIYEKLKKEGDAFIVMSNNMKERVMALGFDEKKISVMPISIDVNSYPFKERTISEGETFQMATVGRFVEKKGIDDILRALAILKNKTDKKFVCNIIGGGPLEDDLHKLAKELDVEDVANFKGYVKIEEIIEYFGKMHLYLQPSKTATDGDME